MATKVLVRNKKVLTGITVMLLIVFILVIYDLRLLKLSLLVVPFILMYVWRDLGFILGFFVFWGTMIAMGQGSIDPGQVDNIIPGLAITLGWGPYLLFYGPVFLLSKSTERYRAKWAGAKSTVYQDLEV